MRRAQQVLRLAAKLVRVEVNGKGWP